MFPINPVDKDSYKKYVYNSTNGCWMKQKYQKVFVKYTASGQVLSNGEIINYSLKKSDDYNCVTTGTSWAFTTPIAGTYMVKACTHFVSTLWSEAYACHIAAVVNGTNVGYMDADYTDAARTSNNAAFGSIILKLNKNDNVWFIVSISGGGSFTMSTVEVANYVTIVKVS